MRAMLASLLLLISGACFAQAFGTVDRSLSGATSQRPDFLPVEQAYQLDVEILDEHSVRLHWQIAPNYYLYQHRFAFRSGRRQRRYRPGKRDARGPAAAVMSTLARYRFITTAPILC